MRKPGDRRRAAKQAAKEEVWVQVVYNVALRTGQVIW